MVGQGSASRPAAASVRSPPPATRRLNNATNRGISYPSSPRLAVQRRSLRVTDATPRRRRQPDPDRVGAPGRRCIGGKGGSAALRQVQRAAERRVGDTSGTPRRLGSRCRSCTVRGRRRTGPRRRRPVAEADLEGARGSGLRDVVRGPALVRGSGEGGRRGMAGRRTRPQLVGQDVPEQGKHRPGRGLDLGAVRGQLDVVRQEPVRSSRRRGSRPVRLAASRCLVTRDRTGSEGGGLSAELGEAACGGAVGHLAARPSVQRSVDDPMATHEGNASGTLGVMEAARREALPRRGGVILVSLRRRSHVATA